MAKPETGMCRIQLGSPDGPSLMMGKSLSSRRRRNGLEVMKVLDIFYLLCLSAQKMRNRVNVIQVVFTGTVELWVLLC